MLKLVIPKGSLERLTLELFDAADLSVRRDSPREYRGSIDDPRVESVAVIRPQEIPRYVEDGHFDLGITGQDWVAETGADVAEICTLPYAKATPRPIKIALAVSADAGVASSADLKRDLRVSTEYVNLTQTYFDKLGLPVSIVRSYGSNEAKVPDIVDAIVHNVETAETLTLNGLRVIDTLMESWTVLVANKKSLEDADKKQSIEELRILLDGAVRAQSRVLVKLNVPADKLDAVCEILPSMKAPTVSKLATGDYFAVETVVAKDTINTLIPELKARGAEDIIELPLSKIVP